MVISELMRPEPSRAVNGWIARQPIASMFITTPTQGEVLFGVERPPDGRRKTDLASTCRVLFEDRFKAHILPFDSDAAAAFARVVSERRRAGRPIGVIDARIAAIARSRGAKVATRDVADFAECGIDVVNPWED